MDDITIFLHQNGRYSIFYILIRTKSIIWIMMWFNRTQVLNKIQCILYIKFLTFITWFQIELKSILDSIASYNVKLSNKKDLWNILRVFIIIS